MEKARRIERKFDASLMSAPLTAAKQKNRANGRISPSGELMSNALISQAALESLKIKSGLERTLKKGSIADNVNSSATDAKSINAKQAPSFNL